MEPHTIRLVVDVSIDDDVDVREAVVTGEVTDVGHGAVRAFSGHLGLITAIEQAISDSVDRRPQPEPTRRAVGSMTLDEATS